LPLRGKINLQEVFMTKDFVIIEDADGDELAVRRSEVLDITVCLEDCDDKCRDCAEIKDEKLIHFRNGEKIPVKADTVKEVLEMLGLDK
jgi:hypothetical protein